MHKLRSMWRRSQLSRHSKAATILAMAALAALARLIDPAAANVITDWDENAVSIVRQMPCGTFSCVVAPGRIRDIGAASFINSQHSITSSANVQNDCVNCSRKLV
jgi:hypothetical protein